MLTPHTHSQTGHSIARSSLQAGHLLMAPDSRLLLLLFLSRSPLIAVPDRAPTRRQRCGPRWAAEDWPLEQVQFGNWPLSASFDKINISLLASERPIGSRVAKGGLFRLSGRWRLGPAEIERQQIGRTCLIGRPRLAPKFAPPPPGARCGPGSQGTRGEGRGARPRRAS